jgi:small subunit ribosomal protein S17
MVNNNEGNNEVQRKEVNERKSKKAKVEKAALREEKEGNANKSDIDKIIEEINKKLEEGIKKEKLLPRGMKTQGKVVSTKRKKTVTVEKEITKYFPKYKRWARASSKIQAHVPSDVELKNNDIVEIAQTRKISKTKAWVVTKLLKREENEAIKV